MSVYSALSTFPSANSHGFRVRISGRADGLCIGRSLRDASYEGGSTKPINRLTNARDPEVPKPRTLSPLAVANVTAARANHIFCLPDPNL
jgi:hypothetical protein